MSCGFVAWTAEICALSGRFQAVARGVRAHGEDGVGARAVQIVHSSRRGSRDIEHIIGSAHDEVQLAALKSVARQRLAAGQPELDFGLDFAALQAGGGTGGGPLAITSSRMGHLWDALGHAFEVLGFEAATGGDEVFRALVLARIIEPTSKLDSLRVIEEAGLTHRRMRR